MPKLYRDEAEKILTDEIRKIEESEGVIWEYEPYSISVLLDLDNIFYVTQPSLIDSLFEHLKHKKATYDYRYGLEGKKLYHTMVLEDLKLIKYEEKKTAHIQGIINLGMREEDWEVWKLNNKDDADWTAKQCHGALYDIFEKQLTEKQRSLIKQIIYTIEVEDSEHEWYLSEAKESYEDIKVIFRCENCDEDYNNDIDYDGIRYLFIDNDGFGDVFNAYEECKDEYYAEAETYDEHDWRLRQAYAGGNYLEVEFQCERCEKTVETSIIDEKILTYFDLSDQECEYDYHKAINYPFTESKKLERERRKLLFQTKWKVFWYIELPEFFKVKLPKFFKKVGRFFVGIGKWFKTCGSTIKEEMKEE